MTEQATRSKVYFVAAFLFTFLFLFTLALTVTPESAAQSSPENAAPPPLLITEVYPNTATRNELDEYVALTNPSTRSINIDCWSITDNEGTIIFPAFEVGSNQTVYVTRNASAFLTQQRSVKREVSKPDFEYGSDSDPSILQLQKEGRALALRNTGDEVILRDASGKEVDVVLFGEATYDGDGWRAEPLEKPREGMIFVRKGVQDTNQCGDWLNLPVGASYHAPVIFPCAGSGGATAFVSPDCSFPVLQDELNHAASTLYINLYEFDNPYLMDGIIEALERGMNVKVLLESSPVGVGGITNEEQYIAETIAERGGEVRLAADPFINHAKYAVIQTTLTITNQNLESSYKKVG
jgi:cardiolipin synthase